MNDVKPEPKASQALVLVVDDDLTTQVLARQSLENAGFKTLVAANGRQGLEIFERSNPDIILLDVEMPEMDGFTACKKLREMEQGKNIPVLMITGLDDLESVQNAYRIGATDFATKPVNWSIMEYRVRYLLRASEAFKELKASESRLAKAQQIANMGNWEWDIANDAMHWSQEVYRIFGVKLDGNRINRASFWELVHPDDRDELAESFEAALSGRIPFNFEYRTHSTDGSERFLHQQAEITFDADNSAIRVSGTFQDISQRKKAEEKIRHLAYYDSLTGLLNRRSFQDRLETVLSLGKRDDRLMAVLFLDLDNFKRINDTLGHDRGDLLLQTVARRLLDGTRTSDCVGRIENTDAQTHVARLGGDEFTVMLTEIAEMEDAAQVAQRILKLLSEPMTLDGHKVFITPSIGISVFPYDGQDVSSLLKNADTAMYHAKKNGKGNFQFYAESMNAMGLKRLKLESDLRQALEKDELLLNFQPIVDGRTSKIIGSEALLRWNSSVHGLVPPDEFIPIAEDNGMIVEFGQWVLRTACIQNKAWQTAGFEPIPISVNLSGLQFRHDDLLATMAEVLRESELAPDYLVLELTEGMIMQNSEKTVTTLRELREMGVRVSIDDFGTGYSSLSYLKQFHLDTLKIDRSFIKDLPDDHDDAAITSAVIAMAHRLNLRIIAEGVETPEQEAFLRARECDAMQGYRYGKPMSSDALSRALEKNLETIKNLEATS